LYIVKVIIMGLLGKSKEEWLNKGFEYFNQEKFEKAIEAFLKSFDPQSPDPIILYNIGLCYNNLEDYQNAIDFFDLVIENDPEYSNAYLMKGVGLESLGRFRLAIKNINKAFEIGIDTYFSSIGYLFLGLAYSQLNNTTDALANFNAALEIDDENVLVLVSKAELLIKNEEYEDAKELIEVALEIDPKNVDAVELQKKLANEFGKNEDIEDDDENKENLAIADKNITKSKKTFKKPENKKKEPGPKGFACVAGMLELKELLTRDVIKPLQNPEKYKKFNVTIPNGILLYGPPGCGKTFIVEKLAEEVDYNFIVVPPSKIGSKYIHDTSGKIAKIFTEAKDNSPTILFFDEFEALVPRRESLGSEAQFKNEEINEFLTHLNNASDLGILVVGATNQPDLIDRAVMRAGRIDKVILVPPPDIEARKELFRSKLSKVPHSSDIDFTKLAEKTEYYSSSDIAAIIDAAGRIAGDQDLDEINEDLMEHVIENSKPSISKSQIESYKSFSHLERK
jgi:SpoVK/Ycf46/Vps4 family AAA+-type ATPase